MKRLFPSLPHDATLGTVFRSFPEKLAPWCEYESLVMRGNSDLSASERELIAAYVSGLNACSYCHDAHTVFARAYGIDPKLIEALMVDLVTAPIDVRLKPIPRLRRKTHPVTGTDDRRRCERCVQRRVVRDRTL